MNIRTDKLVFLSDFLNLRRKYHRHHCPHRRCLPLHSRVPFP
uniref:Apelin receptor early endogenous ligand n=1 Tax=Sparus aurata TaxID=8175 RepID=A0A671YXM6_SPAAU